MTINCQNISELPDIAQKIISYAESNSTNQSPIWLFEGEMGAGKTTLIKAICYELGVLNHVQSPTFSIVNEYFTKSGETIYHFDCYRLKRESEALDIGIEEYFDSGNRCFIEWAEKIPSLIPPNHLKISILVNEKEERELIIKNVAGRVANFL